MNMVKPNKKDLEKIKDLVSLFPKVVRVKIIRSQDGGFVAEILTLRGCITEADTPSELVAMINDCVRTYLEIPEKFHPFVPEYVPEAKALHYFYRFPTKTIERNIRIKLPPLTREAVKS